MYGSTRVKESFLFLCNRMNVSLWISVAWCDIIVVGGVAFVSGSYGVISW